MEALVHDGWIRTRAALEALAADPADPERWVTVAVRWAATAVKPPVRLGTDGRVPMGFSLRPEGITQDAAATRRALDALSSLIDAGLDPEFLLPMRAELHWGWRRYDAAAADWRAALAVTTDPEASDELRRRIERCRSARDAEPRLTEDQLGAVRAKAEQIGRKAPNLVHFEPVDRRFTGAVFPGDPVPGLSAADTELRIAGLRHMSWYASTTPTGTRYVAGCWSDGTTALCVSARDPGGPSTSAETVLTDGRVITTTLTRGRNLFLGGPWIDVLHVDPTETRADLLALHRARVAVTLATTPGLGTERLDTIDDYIRLCELVRGHRLAFRRAEGMTEAECRGVPFGPPDIVVPTMISAARRAMQDAELARQCPAA